MTYSTEMVKNKLSKRFVNVVKEKWFRYLLCTVFGFLISGGRILNACTIFGVSYVSACGAGIYGVLSLIGSGIGYVFYFGFNESAEYIAASVIVYTIAFVCQYTFVYGKRLFMSIISFLVIGITLSFGVISTVRTDFPIYVLIGLESLGGFLMSCVYSTVRNYFSDGNTSVNFEFIISVLLCLSSVILSGVYIRIADVLSVGIILSLFILLTVGFNAEPFIACLTGVLVGLAIDISGIYTSSCLYFYVVYSLFSSLKRFKSRLMTAMVLIGCSALYASLVISVDLGMMFFESVIASFIFVLVPKRVFYFLNRARIYTDLKNNISNAFYSVKNEKIQELISDIQYCLQCYLKIDDETNTADCFACAIDRVCTYCGRKDLCWSNHQNELLDMYDGLIEIADTRGKLQGSDFSSRFCEYCCNHQGLVNEINFELRKKAEKNEMQKMIYEYRESLYELLNILSETIKDTESKYKYECVDTRLINHIRCSLEAMKCDCEVMITQNGNGKIRIELVGDDAELFLKNSFYLDALSEAINVRLRAMQCTHREDVLLLLEAEPYTVSVGVASKKKKGERVCGDQSTYFKTEDGILYVILSDGLGTGEFAKKQSTQLIQLLERFLICDLCPLDAMRLVNVILKLSNSELWNCATIDLLSLNLYSGEAEIYKFGAAPSYFVSKEGIHCINGKTMSAGMVSDTDLHPDVKQFILAPGDIIIMVSDGIVTDETTLYQQVTMEAAGGMKNCARTILLESQKHYSLDDDMTVLAIGMDYRK